MFREDPPSDSSDEPLFGTSTDNRVSIYDVLKHFKKEADKNLREQGNLWEQFIIIFLQQDPIYKSIFKNVKKYPGQDLGIDIVAEERFTGRRWAFQAKFYTAGNVSMADVDGFMSAAEGYDERVVVSTAPLGDNAWKSLFDRDRPGRLWLRSTFEQSRLDFQIFLEQAFFETQSNLEHSRCHDFKELYPHQEEAVADVIEGFKDSDRGKLIMACGTGKTFTALKLAEKMVPPGGSILFLAPSLSLVSQTLHEWQSETHKLFRAVAVCSDADVRNPGKSSKSSKSTEDEENLRLILNEFSLPVTTRVSKLVKWFNKREEMPDAVSVVYSTYQSLEAVSEAQKEGNLPAFDLVICDEAHRTASTRKKDKPKDSKTADGEKKREAHFSLIHDEDFIRATKRLYMTATPKIYGPNVIEQADMKEVVVYSMDDESQYGPEFHRLGFGSAVEAGLLSDYRVMILVVDEGFVDAQFRKYVGDPTNPLDPQLAEVARIVGSLNGLRKYRWDEDSTSPIRIDKVDSTSDKPDTSADNKPMRRALAFLNTIKDSKRFITHLDDMAPEFAKTFTVKGEHVDGTMSAGARSDALERLREATEDKDPPECRIVSNVRCLSEGVDVPALDAVMFLAPRKSKIDIVQSVGRVMRTAKGKDYGYIILPIVIPAGLSSEEDIQDVLEDNERFDHIWEILEALRSHDDRFDIHINQLALNESQSRKKKGGDGDGDGGEGEGGDEPRRQEYLFEHLQKGIRAKIVQRVGTRWYWKLWAQQVGEHARGASEKIHTMLKENSGEVRAQFDEFLTNLQATLNSSVGEEEAVDMLAQHLVAGPVFDALFKDYAFSQHNPVSQAMQKMLDMLSDEKHGIKQENDELKRFYNNVRRRIEGINASGRQHLILEIYNNFFSAVFPKTAEVLGIVYTPTAIVDFILHSVDYIAQKELGKSLGDEGVHILDPFTGTGTFMARLIQSNLIPDDDALKRKFLGTSGDANYDGEFHATEIVLLAYYIAAVNIEEAYHSRAGGDYQPFGGILFGDTFKMADQAAEENQKAKGEPTLADFAPGAGFEDNSRRAEAQRQHPIRVIVGNPPYSMRQKSANDANQNLEYLNIDKRIKETYVQHGGKGSKQAMYDSCIRALRLASDKIGNEGVIGFVTNGRFLDSGSASGLRYCLEQEFSHVYCFDLRGNIRLDGKKEGGNVFGNNSSVSVVILILVKKADHEPPGTIYYHDIGDYLTGKAKLDIIAELGSIENIPNILEKVIIPNKYHDWINQRSETLNQFIPMGIKKEKGKADTESIFTNYSLGIASNRDAWVYNFSREKVLNNMQRMITEYNQHVQKIGENPNLKTKNIRGLESWINHDPTQIKWSQALQFRLLRQNRLPDLNQQRMALSQYRPFAKRHFYYERNCLERLAQLGKFFPTPAMRNKMICISGMHATKDFSAMMVDSVPESAIVENGQYFPFYAWEEEQSEDMLPEQLEASRQENITDYALALFREAYPDLTITKEDIFYYIYGILHSPEYRECFGKDLKKILARIPLAEDFAQFRNAGRELGELHLNYEDAEPYSPSLALDEATTVEPTEENFASYRVEKMRFGKMRVQGKLVKDTSIIHYNGHITLEGIPSKAYDYKINSRSAIEWVMDQYRLQTHEASGIVNDPNDWARKQDNPRYILDLLRRVITVSVETMKIVDSLPTKKSFREDDATLALIKTFAPPRKGGA